MSDKAEGQQGSTAAKDRKALLKEVLQRRGLAAGGGRQAAGGRRPSAGQAGSIAEISPDFYEIGRFPELDHLRLGRKVAERLEIENPFLVAVEGKAGATLRIAGRDLLNFATYNYLGLSGHPEVSEAAKRAIDEMGTSPGASRLVSGERPIHGRLEQAIADMHGTEASIVFVSGHMTNVSAISTLLRPRDLILHDRLAHNSIIVGAQLSGATRLAFPHNDMAALETMLKEHRHRYERVLIAVEGIYSMDGDAAPLHRLIELKRRFKALLMVDEAHSVGVMGARGHGIGEELGCAGGEVDVWMGTLSKSFAGCGGYVAGCRDLVELMRFGASGFVYSVGMSPPLAAASLAAIRIMHREPERIEALRRNARLFLDCCRAAGLNCGLSDGYNIIPVIVGKSVSAARLSNRLAGRGINAQPILYPAVEERAARVRFFVTALHSEEQIRQAATIVAEEMANVAALDAGRE